MSNSMVALQEEVARALSRLSNAISRLETLASAGKCKQFEAAATETSALRQDAEALRELHHAVAGKLDHAIERLRVLVGEESHG